VGSAWVRWSEVRRGGVKDRIGGRTGGWGRESGGGGVGGLGRGEEETGGVKWSGGGGEVGEGPEGEGL